jgi:hypothetical protein
MTKRGGKVAKGRAAPKPSRGKQRQAMRGRNTPVAKRGRSGLYPKGPSHTAGGRSTGKHANKARNRQKVRNNGFGNTRKMRGIKRANGGGRSYPTAKPTARIKRYGLTHSTIPKSAWKKGGITTPGGARVKLNTVW